MKCHGISIVALSLLVVVGCGQPNKGFFRAAPTVIITGIVAKSKTTDNYAFANLNQTSYDHKSMKKAAKAGRKFATTQYVKIDISGDGDERYHDYFVVLGPHIGSNEEATGVLHNTAPTFEVDGGWAYLSGNNIEAKTDWVSAAAQGTEIVVQIVNSDEQIVYLLAANRESANVTLTCKSTDPKNFENTGRLGYFVRVKDKCTYEGPFEISSDQDAQDFIDGITPIMAAAN